MTSPTDLEAGDAAMLTKDSKQFDGDRDETRRLQFGCKPNEELNAKIKASVEAYKALPPLQRAIVDLEQRRSFVHGMVSDETSQETVDAHLDTFPEYVVLEAYKALASSDLTAKLQAAEARVEALRANNKAAVEANTWQPIKTAPKDGTRVLVGWYDGIGVWLCFVAGYNQGFWYSYGKQLGQPNYWRPLPAAPVKPSKD